MNEVLWIIPVVLLVVFVIRLTAGGMDHDRVRAYVAESGGRVLELHWTPFGPGWFGSQNERLYHLRYADKDGAVHEATCKTSALAGVYFTEDRIVSPPEGEARRSREELERENRELRERLADLERRSR